MLIDTHAHVNFSSFKDDAKEVLQRALDNGVWVVNVGSQIDTSRQAVEVANQFKEGVYAAVGLHPEHTHSQFVDEEETHFKTREEHFDTKVYRSLAENPKVVGIGECGLDYYRLPEDGKQELGIKNQEEIKQLQKDAFIQQIDLAKELDKALIVHSRSSKGTDDAVEDILGILKQEVRSKYQGEGAKRYPSTSLRSAQDDKTSFFRFVLHSFTGSPDFISEFIKMGGFVSFNGIITFDKTGNMEKVVKAVPLKNMILETDCPYLTPVPNRGKRNEPLFVKFVADKVAEIKNISVDEVADTTTKNAKRLFKI